MLIVYLFMLCIAGLANSECPGDDVFVELESTCYYFSSEKGDKQTWYQARTVCQAMGTLLGIKVDLAEVGSSTACMSDGLMMQKITEEGEHAWLGATDADTEGSWTWVTSGRSLSIMDSYWYHEEPNNYGDNENCLAAYNWGEYQRAQFSDNVCSTAHAFVCQIY